jgi:hypothetical protein
MQLFNGLLQSGIAYGDEKFFFAQKKRKKNGNGKLLKKFSLFLESEKAEKEKER